MAEGFYLFEILWNFGEEDVAIEVAFDRGEIDAVDDGDGLFENFSTTDDKDFFDLWISVGERDGLFKRGASFRACGDESGVGSEDKVFSVWEWAEFFGKRFPGVAAHDDGVLIFGIFDFEGAFLEIPDLAFDAPRKFSALADAVFGIYGDDDVDRLFHDAIIPRSEI